METQQQLDELCHLQQSLALTGRLLFITINGLSQRDLADSYLPTLDIISASGLDGILVTEEVKTQKIHASLEPGLRTLGFEDMAWFELLGYDASIKGIPSFKNRHQGMRAFMVTDEENVKNVGRAMDMDVLQQPPALESLCEAAVKAVTDPDGTHDAGFLFLTTKIDSKTDRIETKNVDAETKQHQKEVDRLEKIDRVLGNVVIPALINSSQMHGIAYTIVVMGDPYRTMKLQKNDENSVPFTITSIRSLCDTLEKRDRLTSPAPKSALASPENAPVVPSSRDSIQEIAFSEKEPEKFGLGTLHVSQVWEVVQKFFVDNLVCDSSNEFGTLKL